MQSMLLAAATVATLPRFAVERGFFPMASPSTHEYEVQADVWYPRDATRSYPVAVFAHGKTAGGAELLPRYSDLLSQLASHGFVVIAPEACPTDFCPDFHKDVLHAIETVRAEPDLHPAFTRADLPSGVAVIGHSMGGLAATLAATRGHRNITAAVALHPALSRTPAGNLIKVPTLYLTGTADPMGADAVRQAFAATDVEGSAYANVAGAGHIDVQNGQAQRANRFVVLFAACHTRSEFADDACKEFAENFCSGTEWAFEECSIKGRGDEA